MKVLIIGTIFCVSSIVLIWIKTWRKVKRIREQIEKDFWNV